LAETLYRAPMDRWRYLTAFMAFVALLNDGCTCNRSEAACTQVLTGLCEFEERCRGGAPIPACEAFHLGFTCTVDVDEGAVCIDAINAALDADCAGAEDLPCPLLQQAGLYETCGGDLVCSSNRVCGVIAGESICTEACDPDTDCPERGGCSVDAKQCFVVCDDVDFVCATDSLCTADGCFTCPELCGDECDAVVEGCDCPVCPECSEDADCEGGTCVEGACVFE
jgi:hypothetical protein